MYVLIPSIHTKPLSLFYVKPLLLFISFGSIFSNLFVFFSFLDQKILLSDLNSNSFPISHFVNLDDINTTYPNLSVTSLPLASMVSLYYLNTDDYEKGIEMNRAHMDINPYIGFTEHAQSRLFYRAGVLDSSYFYSKLAFTKFPRNESHSSNLQLNLERLSKFEELEKMFSLIEDKHSVVEWSNYLKIISEKDTYDSVNINYAKKALLLFPKSDDIYNYSNYIIYGKKNVFKSVELNTEANTKFKEKLYEEAILLWSQALSLTPYETAFHENITRSYVGLQDFKKAIEYMESLDKEVLNKNDNYLYFLGVCYLNTNELENACINLRKSAKKGNKNSLALVNSYCN